MIETRDDIIAVVQTVLNKFREDHGGDITAARILTLLTVAQHPGIQQIDVGQYVKDLSPSAISRNVVDWGELTTSRAVGPDFIAQRPDPAYRRRNLLYPTPKGLQYIERTADSALTKLRKSKAKGTH